MPTSAEDAAHLLRRVGFGGTEAEVDALTGLEWSAAVDHVLDSSAAPPATLDAPVLPPPDATLDPAQWGAAYRSMVEWWLERCRTTPVPIVEKMTLFWHGVLTSSLANAPHQLVFDQNQLYRTKGLGRFDELIQATAVDPAMLIYLDNRGNLVGGANENFARELMELFLLGVGQYSEDDVKESARAWTGHTMNPTTWRYEFQPGNHDNGAKHFLGVTANWNGPQVIDHLVNGPLRMKVARHVARRAWSAFAYPQPPTYVVDALASRFARSGMHIAELMRAIFLHPSFRSDRARNELVRTPVEYVVAAMRYGRVSVLAANPQWQMKGMGQELFLPPTVEGWGHNEARVSVAAGWAKLNFASDVARLAPDDLLDWTGAMTPERAADETLRAFGVTDASPATRQMLADYVVADRAAGRRRERTGLMVLAMSSPEFSLA